MIEEGINVAWSGLQASGVKIAEAEAKAEAKSGLKVKAMHFETETMHRGQVIDQQSWL